MMVARLFERLVQCGDLTLIDAHGGRHRFGDGSGPPVTIRLIDPALHRRLVLKPRLAFGEAYMDGSLRVEQGDLLDVLSLLMTNADRQGERGILHLYSRLDALWRRMQQFNPAARSRRNVAHHYDLSGEMYRLFLDPDQQYSCAYFAQDGADLEAAQLAKKRHIAAKLLLQPGQRVLDIGSGWGGLALHLAQEHGVDVTGLTLSVEQQKAATERAAAAGLADRVRFRLQDYRQEAVDNPGGYDRIVSVGMFEHVGVGHYRTFFETVAHLLNGDGLALLHSIGRRDGPGNTNPWLRKYIFPGGYSPALSEVLPHIEAQRLWVTDIEILRLHYAETLRHWRQRFNANWDRVRALYDERFCRMWDFYLAGCEASFRVQDMMVFQVQMARRVDAVPLTRQYLYPPSEADAADAGQLDRGGTKLHA